MNIDEHYNNTLRLRVTQHDLNVGYIDVKIDPYLVASVCSVGGGAMEHIMKKAMRGESKGHKKNEVYKEIIAAAKRAIELNNLISIGKDQ
jgi:hypothetical protein